MGSMTTMRSHERIIEWGSAGFALEEPSGDRHVVVSFPGGALVALLDGLGHGSEAAAASLAAISILEAHPSEAVLSLIQRCHDSLRTTRGAVMSMASFNALDSSMSWIGVGNVGAVLLRKRSTPQHRDEAIAARGGVVGFQLPPLRGETLKVFSGDTLIMATDGIRDAFTTGMVMEHSPQEIAESIVARFAKGSDDAHVVVVRYVGASR
jgi:serine phosphatase RsbU (regulator of sigma subunit)